MWKGKFENYRWVVSENGFRNLFAEILTSHKNQHLHITSFDSGPIKPTDDEISIGWYSKGDIMVSPPLDENVTVTYDQYDEWYLAKSEIDFPDEIEIFVNYGGFNLASPDQLTKDDDPTRERDRCDFLYPIQNRFWRQIAQINPETYVAIGDYDVIVSKNENLLNGIEEYA